jgi:hypothetical protein
MHVCREDARATIEVYSRSWIVGLQFGADFRGHSNEFGGHPFIEMHPASANPKSQLRVPKLRVSVEPLRHDGLDVGLDQPAVRGKLTVKELMIGSDRVTRPISPSCRTPNLNLHTHPLDTALTQFRQNRAGIDVPPMLKRYTR